MERPLILVLEPFDTESHSLLEAAGGEVRLGRKDRAYTEPELIREVALASAIVITSRDKITRNVIESAQHLKIIAKCGAKPSNVDLDAATEHGIAVTWTPGSNPVSVAEHALTLMLLLLKKVIPTMTALKEGEWRKESVKASELAGKTVGIVGLGQAGYQLAQLLRHFSCRVLYFDPYVPEERGREVNAEPVDLNYLLEVSDLVSLHCQLSDETRHMIDEQQLRRMKTTAYLVNTARGPLVNEQALIRALREGWIAGAGLDVFEEEPAMCTNPLFALPNVVVTPHMAGWTHEALRREACWAAEEVIRVLKGEPPRNVVNPAYVQQTRIGTIPPG